MNLCLPSGVVPRVVLAAETAADLMTPNPASVRDVASVKEAVCFLIDKGFSAAPVIDEAGRPVGVLSRADILVHDREKGEAVPGPGFYDDADLTFPSGERPGSGFHLESPDPACVGEIMTPVVFAVPPDAPAATVVEQMSRLKVHRLFVVDAAGVLVGVISSMDIVRNLGVEEPALCQEP